MEDTIQYIRVYQIPSEEIRRMVDYFNYCLFRFTYSTLLPHFLCIHHRTVGLKNIQQGLKTTLFLFSILGLACYTTQGTFLCNSIKNIY